MPVMYFVDPVFGAVRVQSHGLFSGVGLLSQILDENLKRLLDSAAVEGEVSFENGVVFGAAFEGSVGGGRWR